MEESITIIGDGAMATVCGLLLDSRVVPTTVWGAFPDHVATLVQTRQSPHLPGTAIPDTIRLTSDDARAFDGATMIVSAVPTQYIREVWTRLQPHLPDAVPIVSVAKGIENKTFLRPTQIIAEVVGAGSDSPPRGVATLSGPSVAHELARCLPATVCAASTDLALAERIQELFTTSWFRVYTNDDLVGVELAGATKNVIALAAGILDGLQAGNNAKSALLARGLVEITRLGVALGARPETFYGLAGVGDLATTCFSPTGRNRTCGEALGKGRPLDEVLKTMHGIVEGVPTTQAVVRLAREQDVEVPITAAVHAVLFEGLDPIEAIAQLMSRQPKPERAV